MIAIADVFGFFSGTQTQRKSKPKMTGLSPPKRNPGGDCTKKVCPNCQTQHGVAKARCPCGHSFRETKRKRVEEQRQMLVAAGGVKVTAHIATIQRLVRTTSKLSTKTQIT